MTAGDWPGFGGRDGEPRGGMRVFGRRVGISLCPAPARFDRDPATADGNYSLKALSSGPGRIPLR